MFGCWERKEREGTREREKNIGIGIERERGEEII